VISLRYTALCAQAGRRLLHTADMTMPTLSSLHIYGTDGLSLWEGRALSDTRLVVCWWLVGEMFAMSMRGVR
jgi:hypothetical protein